jgi:hypothetical protein
MGPSQNLTASFFALPRFGGSREGRKTLVGQERWFQTGGW